jgi:hypothetical protein
MGDAGVYLGVIRQMLAIGDIGAAVAVRYAGR